MTFDYADYVRMLNIILALVCIVMLVRKYIKHWDRYQVKTKDYWWVLMSWSLAVLFTSIEVLLELDTQIRVFFTCFSMILMIKVLIKPNEVDHPTFTKEL